jgi:Cytidine and deoxycytidylate deaminase zinc-binding region
VLALPNHDDASDPLIAAALAAACSSYAPYSRTYAGVGLRTADGTIVAGRYAENAAFNPSLAPIQGAMIMLAFAGQLNAVIEEAVLVEAGEWGVWPSDQLGASQYSSTKAILGSIAPLLPLNIVNALDPRSGATVQASTGLDSTDTSALS